MIPLKKIHIPSWLLTAFLPVVVTAIVAIAFGSTFLSVKESRDKARAQYIQMRRAVQETEDTRLLLESRIESLRTHVDAVRLQARNEFRLILPGERIEVFSIRESPESPERLLANTLP